MTITLCMLLDMLMYKYPGMGIGNYHSCPVNGVKVLPAHPEDFAAGFLYVGGEDGRVVLRCGEGQDVRIETDLSFDRVFNELQDDYSTLRDWDMHMHLALIQDGSVQDLIDLSLPILQNPLTFLDPSFKLVAYTKDVSTPAKIFHDILKYGCLPAKTVEMYERTGFFSTLLEAGGEQFSRTAPSYISVIHAIQLDGSVAGYLSMPCTGRYYTEGEAELFEVLCENVKAYLTSELKNQTVSRYMYEYLLADLLDAKEMDNSNLSERARYIGLPLKSQFRLLKVFRAKHDPLLLEFHVRKLADMLPTDRVFVHKKEPYILLDSRRKYASPEEHLVHALGVLEPFLDKENIYCGVSRPFEKLADIRYASAEADAAIHLGLRVEKLETLRKLGIETVPPQPGVFQYEGYALHHMVEACSRDIPLERLCFLPLLRLVRADRKDKTNHTQVLHAYLRAERRVSKAAETLHMHRNNVVYRIEKIEDMLHISLGEEQTRRQLELSFVILELMEL